MSVFKCKMCGGTLEINENQTTAICEYCGTQQTLPKLNDDRKSNLYDRANHFRRNNEFDKAMGIYEKILNEDTTDAEAYWSIVLCRYGIEYVEDPTTHKRVPTVNRTQFTSIFNDDNYKSALKYADSYQKIIYEKEANIINEIQKGILEISQKEEPFDVFICYKETDNNGRRTQDSVLANDIYHQLTQEGFKVFFSRITLEDKLGIAYEPYIFAALNSSKVMVVVGTKPEYFNAVWVKNEWSRYLALIKNGANKILIPAYRDMDPYDLPEEFSHLQAQDMSKLGFLQDLIRGIKKIIEVDEPNTLIKETVVANNNNRDITPLLKRVFIYLEDKDWTNAYNYCERVLDIDPENANAYLCELMAELNVRNMEELKKQKQSFDNLNNYQKAYRFGDENLKNELKDIINEINYRNAEQLFNEAKTEGAYKITANKFKNISGYKDSEEKAKVCLEKAEICRKKEILSKGIEKQKLDTIYSLEEAIRIFDSISGFSLADERKSDCTSRIEELNKLKKERKRKIIKGLKICSFAVVGCIIFTVIINSIIFPIYHYKNGVSLMEKGEYNKAISAFISAKGYKNSDDLLREFNSQSITVGREHTVGLKSNGTVVAIGNNTYEKCNVENWTNIISVATGYEQTVGLKSDGTVVAIGYNYYGQCNVEDWDNIVSISVGGHHTVGLKSNGTVVAVGSNEYGQCNVEDWNDIVAISARSNQTIGLKSDGTVVAVGNNENGQCDVEDWTDIVSISVGDYHTVGLKSDGTVVAVGRNELKQCDIEDWNDIVAISAGGYYTVGLKSDGTVVAVGRNYNGQCNVENWNDIVAISAGEYHTIGLKSDGTVVAVGHNAYKQCDVDIWTDIKLPKNNNDI